jgi:hypothetical protein
MAADSPTPPAGDSEPRLSWRDRELLSALRRLANSRAQVQALEAAMEQQQGVAPPDPADAERVGALEAELTKLRAKAGGRFGGGAARERIPEVEMQQRLVLERLGFASYADFTAAGGHAAPAVEPVDPRFLEFARHEVAAAEEAYEQLLSMPDDDDANPAPSHRAEGRVADERPDVADRPRTIDLTSGENSA